MINRVPKQVVNVGGVKIGGSNPVIIQSMTNTKTSDIDATVKQIQELTAVGCQIVRVAVLNIGDAKAIAEIKKHISIPIVADIHFDYRLALQAIESGVDKLRINPGNIGSKDRVEKVVNACKEKGIPIRIGVNMGSLDKDVLATYGRTAKALVESARKHVEILESLEFYDIVISLKASDVLMTIEAYEFASQEFNYPLHIGITEAGTKFSGTIKSSIGLGIILYKGIGDTLRISLAADPGEEIKVAKELLATFGLYKKPILIACPSCGRTQYDMFPIVNEIESYLDTLKNTNIKVAIMGCVVNGPGEAKDADIGIAGGVNDALLIKKWEIIRRIKQKEIVNVLKEEITKLIENM